MDNLFSELKRRHIYRVAAAYAVVAWVLIQLVGVVIPLFDLPVWVGRATFWFLFAGFPIALLFAWIHELTPSNPAGALGRAATGKLDWVLIGALVVVIALASYQQFAPAPGAGSTQQAEVAAERAASIAETGAVSIAVLPFENLSGDASQEYFSDGMTEEITAALAKVPDLKVVARTSAFQFRAQDRDIQSIGRQLHATHFIEGSVRKEGNRVRITAQLIRAEDGTHVWTESYDRELTGIFAVQEDIARAITGALRMPLGLKPGENLVNNRSIDPESYQQFLRARVVAQVGGPSAATESLALVEQVVARNPDYAPAVAYLAFSYIAPTAIQPALSAAPPGESRRVVEAYLSKGEATAKRAIQLDPNLPGSYVTLGFVMFLRGNMTMSEELMQKALALDPNDPETLNLLGLELAARGQVKEAVAIRQQLRALEPFVPTYNRFTAIDLWVDGQNDAAIAILQAQPPDAFNRSNFLAMIYASMGRYTEAADMLANVPPGEISAAVTKEGARLLRTAPSSAPAPQSLPQLPRLPWVYLHVGAPERALEPFERGVAIGLPNPVPAVWVWHPSWAPVRKTERFKAYVRSLGLVEYWRAKGWPQFCHPTIGDDFICE